MHGGTSQRHGAGLDGVERDDCHHQAQDRGGKFWEVKFPESTVLTAGEIMTAIQMPAPPAGAKSAFLKFAVRKSIDFPIVNCAVMVGGGAPRIALNAVAPKPYRAAKAEAAIAGKPINEQTAEAAGAAAVEDAKPLKANKYKVQIADFGQTRPAGQRLRSWGEL